MVTKKDKFLAAAQKFLERGSLEKALAEFQRAAQEDPKDTRTWLRIAEIYVKRGDASQATGVYLRTADIYVEQGFFQRAVAVYKNVLKLTPGHTDAHFKLADVYKQLGLFSDAAQQYDHAATTLQKEGRIQDAMKALGQIVEMNPDQTNYRVKLAEVAAQGGLIDDAVREFGRAAEEFLAQGRAEEHLRVAERLLALRPDDHALGKQIAGRYLERQMARQALAKLQVCFSADAKDPETLSLLADAFEQLGQTAKTLSVLKELVKIYEYKNAPTNRDAAIARIAALDPNDPLVSERRTPPPGAPVERAALRPSGDRLPAVTDLSRPHRGRAAAITFSELAVPSSIAPGASGSKEFEAPAKTDLSLLDDEQVAAEIDRILAETDIFVKFALLERAADHLGRVLEVRPEHVGAQERLVAIYVRLGRKAEAVEALGMLASQQMISDPEGAKVSLRRALEIEPGAEGARTMLAELEAAGEQDPAELEIDPQELQPFEVEEEAQEDEAVPAEIGDASLEDFEIDLSVVTGANASAFGRTQTTVEGEEEEEQPDDWSEEAPATQIDQGTFGAALQSLQSGAGTAEVDDEAISEEGSDFGEEDEPATRLAPGLDLAAPRAALGDESTTRVSISEEGVGSLLEGLDIDFDLPAEQTGQAETATRIADSALDAGAAADLQQVDFFLEQEMPDEARVLLQGLPAALADHAALRDRWVRVAELERRLTSATRAAPLSARDLARAAAPPGRPASPLPPPPANPPGPGAGRQGWMGAVPVGTHLGDISRPQGGREPAITPRAVVATGEEDASTQRDLGIAYKEMGLLDAAITEFSKLLDTPPNAVFALTMIGECYEAKGAPAEALLHYKKALNLPGIRDDETTQLYYQLGGVFQALGDKSEALYFLEKVARRSQHHADVLGRIAALRAQGVAPLDRQGEDSSGGTPPAGWGAAGGGERGRR